MQTLCLLLKIVTMSFYKFEFNACLNFLIENFIFSSVNLHFSIILLTFANRIISDIFKNYSLLSLINSIFVMDVVSRLKYFMDSSGLTISQFADTCTIPRPTMSQLISGRNKRISNEIFDKIHNGFPNLSILWLMFGEGDMLLNENIEISERQNTPPDNNFSLESIDNEKFETFQSSLFSSSESDRSGNVNERSSKNAGSGIEDAGDGIAFSADKAELPRHAVYFSEDVTSKTGNDDVTAPSGNPYSEIITSGASYNESNTQHYSTRAGAVDHNVHQQTIPSNQRVQQSEQQTPLQSPNQETVHVEAHRVSIAPDSRKKITNIVVFYSDNSFQSFLPDI